MLRFSGMGIQNKDSKNHTGLNFHYISVMKRPKLEVGYWQECS